MPPQSSRPAHTFPPAAASAPTAPSAPTSSSVKTAPSSLTSCWMATSYLNACRVIPHRRLGTYRDRGPWRKPISIAARTPSRAFSENSDVPHRTRPSNRGKRRIRSRCLIRRNSCGFSRSLGRPASLTTSLWPGGYGDLSTLKRWEKAWRDSFHRHEALRTCFPLVEGKPMQRVNPAHQFQLEVADVREVSETRRHGECERLMAEEARQPFDLSAGPVFRAVLLRCTEQEQILMLNVHHIVADGTSVETLLSELEIAYAALARGLSPELPQLPVQYRDYSMWERECLRDLLEKYLNSWSRRLGRRGAARPGHRPEAAEHPDLSGAHSVLPDR